MREYKFRGKRIDNGEWVYGYYSPVNLPIVGNMGHYINEGGYKAIEIDPSTVGQHTGLHDRNGKEIYEGDILDGSYINPLTEQKITRHYQVEFNRGNFYAGLIDKSPYGDTMLYFQNERCEVIGNIYEI